MQRSCLLGYIKSGRLRELGRQTWNKIGAGCFGFGAESANSKYGVQLDDLATLGCVEAIRCQIQILGSNKHFGADQELGARNSFLGTRNKYSPENFMTLTQMGFRTKSQMIKGKRMISQQTLRQKQEVKNLKSQQVKGQQRGKSKVKKSKRIKRQKIKSEIAKKSMNKKPTSIEVKRQKVKWT